MQVVWWSIFVFYGHEYQNKKAWFTDPIFREGFGKYIHNVIKKKFLLRRFIANQTNIVIEKY